VDEDQPETQPPGFLGVCGERESGVLCILPVMLRIASDMASLWNRGFLLLQFEMLTNDLVAMRIALCMTI
jgi:hypothetical protein